MAALELSDDDIHRIVTSSHSNPRSVLGFHELGEADSRHWVIRVFEPDAESVSVIWEGESEPISMRRLHAAGLFELVVTPSPPLRPYQLLLNYKNGRSEQRYDHYYFAPELGELDLYLFGAGDHHHIYKKLGAHLCEREGVTGTLFAVWAPTARRVSVVGDFNFWDGRKHAMHARESSGVWELFVPGCGAGEKYKFEILGFDNQIRIKCDPYGFGMEMRPGTCSIVTDLDGYEWNDAAWLSRREESDPLKAAVNIYEVHPGSWGRNEGEFFSWNELGDRLIPYVRDMGYTHIELMGLAEHPLDLSWGYQVTGYYAANSRFGSPHDLMRFIDRCHQDNIGVIMDWVPGHFPRDDFALARFDGTFLYEHSDPRRGEHVEWGTKVFNYGRNEVRNFLVANALFWLDYYHIDGLRVDAVASMLYLDYSRPAGEWIPNQYGGRENLEAIEFLQQYNQAIFRYFPGILSIAEESTAFPGVTNPPDAGGLGFNFKWNMGWMNDTLRFISEDPIHRKHHASLLTFAMVYAWSENFILPISHDEVVHGKQSLLSKMPGDEWQKRANLRLYLAFMTVHPGKQLLFMGQEFGQWEEWREDRSLDWHLLEQDGHRQLQSHCRELNHFYRRHPQLYASDTTHEGFEWVECQDTDNSVYAFLRRDPAAPDTPLLCVFNFTPVPRPEYRIGVPQPGQWQKLFDSDAGQFGGSGSNQQDRAVTSAVPSHGREDSLTLDLPPLGFTAWLPA